MNTTAKPTNFIRQIIDEDLKSGKHTHIKTRFPPEPNGFLHVGHAKSICLNFGIAQDYAGATCNLRFDDTNPYKEDPIYFKAIQEDIHWLGFKWDGELRHASDYFQQLHDYAVQLIKMGKAFVCSLTGDQMREMRGNLKEGGRPSPDRNRSIEDNLDLFARMKNGEFADGAYTLRAKIDMSSGNINMRDPVIYRILRTSHPMTGDLWCLYPMYDYAHCLSDAIEGITHSLCTLEFEDHRPLYDWILDTLKTPCHPRQIEFARLNLNYTITSKRKLKELVDKNVVEAWDDPRMTTLSGMRRRGFTPAGIIDFCNRVGVTKKETVIDFGMLEECVRNDLNEKAKRVFCVLDPIKIVIENFPEDKTESLMVPNHPQKPEMGDRALAFTREIYIEREDFMEQAPKGFFRLVPGGEVRLRFAYIIKCERVITDSQGNITELRCTYDVDTLGKNPEGRKVKGVIHWVSARYGLPCTVRIYDRLFNVPDPTADEKDGVSYLSHINPDSLQIKTACIVEASLKDSKAEDSFQFERLGYFAVDKTSKSDQLVFNRSVSLRDTWAKVLNKT
jgi:glutaminyl-tRNA synthetase